MQNELRDVATRWFEEVWNKGRREAIAEILLPDGVLHEGGKDSIGPEGFYPYFDRLQTACSDIHVTVEQTIVEDDVICVRWLCTMTHTGPGLGMEPTGTALATTGITIIRVADGRFAEGWQNWDMLGLIQQIERADDVPAPLYV